MHFFKTLFRKINLTKNQEISDLWLLLQLDDPTWLVCLPSLIRNECEENVPTACVTIQISIIITYCIFIFVFRLCSKFMPIINHYIFGLRFGLFDATFISNNALFQGNIYISRIITRQLRLMWEAKTQSLISYL